MALLQRPATPYGQAARCSPWRGIASCRAVAGSLLRTLGLPELIAHTFDEYKALALRLARNPAELSKLRTLLAANRLTSSLFDAKTFARNLEKAYATMWEIHAAGGKPRGFAIQ